MMVGMRCGLSVRAAACAIFMWINKGNRDPALVADNFVRHFKVFTASIESLRSVQSMVQPTFRALADKQADVHEAELNKLCQGVLAWHAHCLKGAEAVKQALSKCAGDRFRVQLLSQHGQAITTLYDQSWLATEWPLLVGNVLTCCIFSSSAS